MVVLYTRYPQILEMGRKTRTSLRRRSTRSSCVVRVPSDAIGATSARSTQVKKHVMFKDMAADTYLASAGIADDWSMVCGNQTFCSMA